jgi:death-on-curing protein
VKEPKWLSRPIALAIHADQLTQHGGLGGLRDADGLDAALERAPNKLHYAPKSSIYELAAAYGFAIGTSHPFNDGNKRTAFMCMYTFLGVNGYRIVSSEPDVVILMIGVADGSIGESDLSDWLRDNCERRT